MYTIIHDIKIHFFSFYVSSHQEQRKPYTYNMFVRGLTRVYNTDGGGKGNQQRTLFSILYFMTSNQ